jgi:hypothetical protein
LTFKVQNEHEKIAWYHVNFKEKAIYMLKNVQICNFFCKLVHILTDPDYSECQKLIIEQLTSQCIGQNFKFKKIQKGAAGNHKGLRKVQAKIEGLNIFAKTRRELVVNKPMLLLPMMTKVQGQRSLAFILIQQNRDTYAPEIYAIWSKFQLSKKMRPTP